jgi:hypothetical protein
MHTEVKHTIRVRAGWGCFLGRHYLYYNGVVIGNVCCVGSFAAALVRRQLGPGEVEFLYV